MSVNGYRMATGRWANLLALLLLASATKTADASSTPKEIGDRGVACLDLTVSAVSGGTDEVQSITIDATGGTFTVTFDGQTTSAVAYNASAATLQTALLALSNLDSGDVVVTGGPGASAAYVLTFGGNYAKRNVPAVTTNAASLTGGASTATVATTTAGVAPTLTVTVETCKTSNGTFRSVGTFTAVAGTDLDDGTYTERKSFSGLDRFVRVSWALTGSSASFTFKVEGEAKLHRAHQARSPL